MADPAQFNPLDPAVIENPYEWHQTLREQAPVYRDPVLGVYLVSRYDDVVELLTDTVHYSANSGPAAVMPPPEALAIRGEGYGEVNTLLTADPPDHIRYRSLVSRAFAPRRVARLEPDIRKVATDLVDDFRAEGAINLVDRFAVPFPLTIIADQLGVPRSDMALFKKWSDDAVAPLGGMISDERHVECAHSIVEFQRYFEAKIEEKRAAPSEDVLSNVVTARIDGVDPLNIPEMLSILQQFLVAGNETTTNAIASAVMLLLQHPDQLALIRNDPALAANAAEEVLRYESPVQTLFRMAKHDLEFRGVPVPAGGRLAVMYAAANRDPRKFDEPDRFDVRRPNAREHLALGRGEHYCIGAGLARKELTVAIEYLAQLPELRFAPEKNDFAHHPSFTLRGLKELHVEFAPH